MSARSKTGFACRGKWESEAHKAGYVSVAGVDEAGRGSLFGPVFAAAVILSPDRPIRGLKDSKVLDPSRRKVLAGRIRERAVSWAVCAADVYEIDRINIYQASLRAMRKAVESLNPRADYLLVDAVRLDCGVPERAMIHGDARSQCIAAASILAKTSRDECMLRWDEVFPWFGLAKHKGYGTEEHIAALRDHGPTLLHRFSFEPVRQYSPIAIWSGYDQREEASAAGA